jgi:hypothetical protein
MFHKIAAELKSHVKVDNQPGSKSKGPKCHLKG